MDKHPLARIVKGHPCPGCPWRCSSAGIHPVELVAQLREIPATPGLMQACHTTPKKVCRGFIGAVGRQDIMVAMTAARAGVLPKDCRPKEPLFGSWDEFFAAHGVSHG